MTLELKIPPVAVALVVPARDRVELRLADESDFDVEFASRQQRAFYRLCRGEVSSHGIEG